MRVFYEEKEKKIIVTPYLNGSTYLMSNSKLNLTLFNPINHIQKEGIKKLLEIENIEKIFIYRDPVERLISFYKKFIFDTEINSKDDVYKFTPKIRHKDFWDEVWEALPLIEKNFKDNLHTNNQYNFFEVFNQTPSDFKIYDVEQFIKWLYLEFAIKETEVAHGYTAHTTKNFFKILRMYDRIKKIYDVDYEKILPHVIIL